MLDTPLCNSNAIDNSWFSAFVCNIAEIISKLLS